MRKCITLLLILLIFSSVNGQDVFQFGKQDVDNSAAKSAAIPRTREEVAAFNGTPHGQSAPALRSTTEVNTLLSEGFEGLAEGTIPAGWTRIAKPGAGGQQIWGASRWNPHNDDDSGTLRSMRILYGPETHDDWIITPALPLESGKSYTITYWLQFAGWEEEGVQFFERLDVKIGKGTTAADMTVLLDHQEVAKNMLPPYLKIRLTYIAPETADFYIGFHSFSDSGIFTAFDDVLIEETPANNLVIMPEYPYYDPFPQFYTSSFQYGQVPVLLHTLLAKASNEGLATQTNVVLNATINATTVTSAPVTALTPDATTDLSIPHAPLVLGPNNITYTVSADQTEDKPSDNSVSFSVKGSKNIYAVDDLITPSIYSWGRHDEPITMGHIYKISNPVTLNGAEMSFSVNGSPLDFNISLYKMAGEFTIDPTPVLTVPAVRNGLRVLHIYSLPETVLEPGNYFLAVNQSGGNGSAANICVTHDRYNKLTYVLEGDGVSLGWNDGAILLRMVFKTDEACTAPSNLKAVANYSSVTCSWEGEATLFEVTLNATNASGSVSTTFATPLNTISIAGLPANTLFSWSVKAVCDGASSSAAVAGIDFTTFECNGVLISDFPHTEGFERGILAIPCWTKISNNIENGFTGETPLGVFKGTDLYPILTPHGGDYVWRFASRTRYDPWNDPEHDWERILDLNQYLITQELKQTTENKSFSFYYRIYDPNGPETFRVGYSTTGTDVAGFTWLPKIIAPPDADNWYEYSCIVPGNAKYIAINSINDYSDDYYHYYLYIDDVKIDLSTGQDAIAEINAAPTTVFPTLTRGSITVNTVSNATVKVMDMAGRILATYQSTGQLPIDLNYTGGVYFILVENGQTITTHKVVLQR